MNAAVPPAFWASAMMCRAWVVFPEDSGPKISMTRPRGIPPMPRAISRLMEPVDMVAMDWWASSDRRMTAPCPNLRSMEVRAVSRASLRNSSGDREGFFAMVLSDDVECYDGRRGWGMVLKKAKTAARHPLPFFVFMFRSRPVVLPRERKPHARFSDITGERFPVAESLSQGNTALWAKIYPN